MARPWIRTACAGFPTVEAAVQLRRPDQIPVALFGINPYCASVAGVRYSDCMLDQDVYVEAIVKLADRFEPDVLMNVGCGIDRARLERSEVVEIKGTRFLRDRQSGELTMRVPDDGNPQALQNGHLLAQASETKRPDPEAIGVPSPDALVDSHSYRAAKRVLSRLGDRMLISRGVCNASNSVVGWLGLQRTCLLMRDDPGYIKALAERATAAACAQVRAQATLGLRLYYTGGSWGSLVGPRDYEQFFADSQIRINRAIHGEGGLALLHLTGRQKHLTEANLASEPDIVLADEDEFAEVREAYQGRACVAGYVEPSTLLLPGPPERVYAEVQRQIKTGGPDGFMVCTTDCVVKDTPEEHVDAMIRAASDSMHIPHLHDGLDREGETRWPS